MCSGLLTRSESEDSETLQTTITRQLHGEVQNLRVRKGILHEFDALTLSSGLY